MILRTPLPARRHYNFIAHCNISRDPVDVLEKIRLRRKLHPALRRLTINSVELSERFRMRSSELLSAMR